MLLYSLVVRLYGFAIFLASFKKTKAKQWIEGRRDWRLKLTEKINSIGNEKRAWFHCASLGEFEQGRPLIEGFHRQHPEFKIVLSFFSPSGYEVRKDYKGADVITYLPLDTKSNAKDFMDIVKPDIIFFIKYEFWVNFLLEMEKHKSPAYLVSAVFKPHHPFFKWYGRIFIRSLRAFSKLFVQDNKSLELLKSIGIENASVCGDTRFDRVLEIRNNVAPIAELELFKGKCKLIVAGSSWPKDEELVVNTFLKIADHDIKLVLAPHELGEDRISRITSFLEERGLTFCRWTKGVNEDKQVLILDTIGKLSRAYFYADVCYVGGGFDDGIHNVLEPAVYYKPVFIYGDSYKDFVEAEELVANGGVQVVYEQEQLTVDLQKLLNDRVAYAKIEDSLKHYFNSKKSATAYVLNNIELV